MQDAAVSRSSGSDLTGQSSQIAGSARSTKAPRHPMVVKAAREMARIHAEACNVNRDDLWMVEGESFIDEAESVLHACGGVELLESLRGVVAVADRQTDEFTRARAAIAKATGEQA